MTARTRSTAVADDAVSGAADHTPCAAATLAAAAAAAAADAADADDAAAADATVDAVSGNSTFSDAAAAFPVSATGGASVCLHISCNDRGTKALLIVNKGLVLVRHGGETGFLSAFDLCSAVQCWGCGRRFQPEESARLPWMDCDFDGLDDHGWVGDQWFTTASGSALEVGISFRGSGIQSFESASGIRSHGSAVVTRCFGCLRKNNTVLLQAGADLPFTRLLLGVRSLYQQEDRKQRLIALMQSHHHRLGSCSALRDLDPALLQSIARALYPPLGPDRVWQKQCLLALMQAHHPRLGACSAMRFLDPKLLQSIARLIYPPRLTALCKPRYEPRRWPGVQPDPMIIVIPDDDAVVAAAAATDATDAGTGGGRAATDAIASFTDAGGEGTCDCLYLVSQRHNMPKDTLPLCFCVDAVCAADIGVKTAGEDVVSVIKTANSGEPGTTGSYRLQERTGRLFDKASDKLAGTFGWGHGIGGSIGPAGTCKIFEHLQLNGRSFIDWGGGNGRVIIAAGCSGAINACAVERPENSGYYSIYRAALKLLDYPEFSDLKEKISFDPRDKLMPVDIDKVVYLNSFSFTFCT